MKETGTQVIDVLLVEDNEDDVVIMKDAFDQVLSIHIKYVVSDGVEAIAFLKKEGEYQNASEPGLVMMDINMPKIDGFQVLEEIKKDQNLNHIPVVILSSSTRDKEIINAYKKGACSYVTKPIDFKEFKEMMKNFAMYWSRVSKIPKINND